MDERTGTGIDDADPQAAGDRRRCARHLLQHPMTCTEHDPELFRLIRRHEMQLDQWFTQRLGYRLHIGADTARLFKIGTVPDRRPLRTKNGRAFLPREYTMLALVLAATAAGPDVISLRDLVAEVRSAAAEADVMLAGDGPERRALVNVLSWMMAQGMVRELFEHIDAYVNDGDADAVLKIRPDRIVLAAVPAPAGAPDADAIVEQATRRGQTRQWMRCRLVEDPVLYRHDLTDAEWGELRRRLGAEEHILEEMFGLVLEARAEGVAAVDASGDLADTTFPAGGTIGHASLLVIDALLGDESHDGNGDGDDDGWVTHGALLDGLAGPLVTNASRWSNDLVESPDKLVRQVVRLLCEVRLGEQDDLGRFRLLPGASRFALASRDDGAAGASGSPRADAAEQDALW